MPRHDGRSYSDGFTFLFLFLFLLSHFFAYVSYNIFLITRFTTL